MITIGLVSCAGMAGKASVRLALAETVNAWGFDADVVHFAADTRDPLFTELQLFVGKQTEEFQLDQLERPKLYGVTPFAAVLQLATHAIIVTDGQSYAMSQNIMRAQAALGFANVHVRVVPWEQGELF